MSSFLLEEHLWFAGSMEREKAEQFLMDVSQVMFCIEFEISNTVVLAW